MSKRVKDVMGKENVWGPEDWVILGYPTKMFGNAPKIPWSPEELEEVKDTHFLFLGVETLPDGETPLTVMVLHEGGLSGLAPVWVADDWLKNRDPIIMGTLSFRWYLTRKKIVENSTGKAYDAQLPLLTEKEEPPTTIQEVFKSLLHHKKTGRRLNGSVYARTRDFVGSESVVDVGYVGCYGGGALGVDSSRRGCGLDGIGLGASRKSDTR